MTTDWHYPLILSDGGRSSANPKLYLERNDCTVRALSLATFIPYDLVHAELKLAGRRVHGGFDLVGYLAHRRHFMGVRYTRARFRRKTTLREVFSLYRTGTVLIELPTHVICVIDGVAHDLWRFPGDTPALGIWRF